MSAQRSSRAQHRLRARQSWRAILAGVVIAALVAVVSAGYEVQPGDTLAGIAAEHGTSVSALAEANRIADPDLIRIGQVLVVPGEAGEPAGSHVVAAGESLVAIAALHGTTVSALVEANGLADPDLLRIGQVLLVPAAAAAGQADTAETGTLHVVAPGETLAGIARAYGITAEALAAANGITDPSTIYAGTTLVIGTAPAPVVAGGGTTAGHIVAAGDTLGSIAARYGTSVTQLVAANQIADPNLIRAGDTLAVPSAAWICPVSGARYFNDWGFPRGGGRFHQGTDLFAPRGTPVVAPVSGTVELKSGTVGGLQFWMTGDDGNLYIGTHLDAFGLAGRVMAGEIIGYVGDSGNARGATPHLHLEIHPGGVSPANPYPTLQAAGC